MMVTDQTNRVLKVLDLNIDSNSQQYFAEELGLDNLQALPNELKIDIVARLLPEEIWQLEGTNNYFNQVLRAPILWRRRFQLHFPQLFDRFKDDPATDWYSLFKEAYKTSLSKLNPQERRLFAQAKEELLTLEDIEKKGFSNLELKDSDARTLYDWIVSKMTQSILDSLYTVILNSNFINSYTDDHNRTRLHWAVQNNQPLQTIKNLTSFSSIKTVDSSGDTPLALAAKYGLLEHAKLLWVEEMRLGYITNRNKLLGLALFNGHFEIVEFLLQQGLSPNEKTEIGYTPLFIAASRGDPAIVRLLLADGAFANETSTAAEISPLYMAVQKGHYDAAKAMLDAADINVNLPCKNGATPLAIAIQKSHAPMVSLLLEYGASLEVTLGGNKMTALSFAQRFKDKDEGKILSLLQTEMDRRISIPVYTRSNLNFLAASAPRADHSEMNEDKACNVSPTYSS